MKGWIRPKLAARSSAVVRYIELTSYSGGADFLPFLHFLYRRISTLRYNNNYLINNNKKRVFHTESTGITAIIASCIPQYKSFAV